MAEQIEDIFTEQIINHYKQNKDEITQDLLDELRKSTKGKDIAFKMLDIEKNEEGYYLDSFGNAISYMNIPSLKSINRKIPLSNIHKSEILKCQKDIHYFMNNYVKIKTPHGINYPELRAYQSEFIDCIINDENESILGLLPRQSGKSVTVAIFLCWLAIFEKDVNIGIAAQSHSMADEFLTKTKDIFINLPIWMTPGVKVWNVQSISLENGVRLLADTASSDSFRGHTITYSVTDESAYITGRDNGMTRFEAYLDSMLPSQSSLIKKKNIFITTANGMNEFYTMWKGALKDGFEEVTEILDGSTIMYGDTIENHYKLQEEKSIYQEKNIFGIEKDNQKYKVHYNKRKIGSNGSIAFSTDWKKVPRWNKDGTKKSPEQFREEEIARKDEVYFNQAYANCVGYNSVINIDNKEIKIGELWLNEKSNYFRLKGSKGYSNSYIIKLNKKVLTPNGYKPFTGIAKYYKNTLKITTNINEIIVAEKHIFVIDNQEIFAKDLKIGDKLQTSTGYCKIKNIEDNGVKDVYDLTNVEGELYYTNNILSHNTFLGSSYTLISADKLKLLEAQEPVNIIDGKLKIYKKFISGHQYVCTVDPSKDGIDKFVVNFTDITSFRLEQVATANLDIDYLLMPEILNEWLKIYGNPFLIIENNEGAGQSVADQMVLTYEYSNIHYDKNLNVKNNVKARKKYPGFRTTVKTRNLILKTMKTFFDNGNLTIHDADTINQLFSFILIDGKYQADQGSHDDCVMSLALVFVLFINVKNITDMKEVTEQLKQDIENSNEVNVAELITVGSFDGSYEEENIKTDSNGISYEGFDEPLDDYNFDPYSIDEFGS